MRTVIAVAVLAAFAAPVRARPVGFTLHVPAEYPTIQAAIDAALDYDIVDIAEGRYPESLTISSRNYLTLHGNGVVAITPQGTDAGISVDTATHLTIQGLAISKGKNDGIALRDSQFVSILNTTVAKVKGNGIWAMACDDLTIADCTVTKTGKDLEGISVSFGNLTPSARCTVQRCNVSKTGGEGINVHGASALIEDCVVTKPKNDGIELDRSGGTDDGVVRRCTVTSSGDVGIIVTGARAVVEDNVVTGAAYYGISIFQDSYGATTSAQVRRNQVKSTRGKEAIHLNAPACTLLSNTVSSSRGDGINVQQVGNTIDSNTVTKSGAYGVHLRGSDHTVVNNTATGSRKADLFDESTGSMFAGNTFPKAQ